MADFCRQCSLSVWGEDSQDLAGLAEPERTAIVLCEGCGPTIVNALGECVDPCCLIHGVYTPKDRRVTAVESSFIFLLFDERACAGAGTDEALILCVADSIEEARADSLLFPGGAIYKYRKGPKGKLIPEGWQEDFPL